MNTSHHLPARLLLTVLLIGLTGCQSLSPDHRPPVGHAAPATPAESLSTETRTEPLALLNALDKPDLVPEALIWDRMREGFQLRKWYGHPRVKAEMASLMRNPTYLARVSERARRYLYHITQSVETRDLPLELALLPVIESAFDPFAYSPQQAAGLWQFIPSTARSHALKNNWWYDGRRDVLASTDAALNYLTHLNQRMQGDWLLAIASYNGGQGRVGRARARAKNPQADDVFWSLDLPAETRHYVPRLLALAAIIDQPELVAQLLYPVPNEAYFTVIEDTGGQIDLTLAAELAEVPVEEIYRLNPGFSRWASDPEGPHHLLLPATAGSTFLAGLTALPAQARIRWERHQVKPGESLGQLARQYHTTVEQIQRSNKLRSSVIVVGQQLLIPTMRDNPGNYALSANARQSAAAQRPVPGHSRSSHTVRAGDSLWSIARQHDTSPEQLARWNNRATKDTLRIGEQLLIWTANPTIAAPAPATLAAAGPDMTRRIGYRVRQGDSLSRIADRFKVSVTQILAWNRLDASHYLQPGQQLTLFVNVGNL